jgi:hypothetical protein
VLIPGSRYSTILIKPLDLKVLILRQIADSDNPVSFHAPTLIEFLVFHLAIPKRRIRWGVYMQSLGIPHEQFINY